MLTTPLGRSFRMDGSFYTPAITHITARHMKITNTRLIRSVLHTIIRLHGRTLRQALSLEFLNLRCARAIEGRAV